MIVIFTLMNTQRVIIAWMPNHIRFAKDMLREGEWEKGKQEVRKGGREKGRGRRRGEEGKEKEKERAGFILKRFSFGRLNSEACMTQTVEFLQ